MPRKYRDKYARGSVIDRSWLQNKEKLDYFVKWYPHFGPKYVAEFVDSNSDCVYYCAKLLGLQMLPVEERLCANCKINKRNHLTHMFCKECDNEYGSMKRRERISKDAFLVRLKATYSALKTRSRKRGFDKVVSLEYLIELFKEQNGKCFYTGRDMHVSSEVSNTGNKVHPDGFSIDRIDSSIGYIEGNLVFCIFSANVAKRALSHDEFIRLCKDIVDYNEFKEVQNGKKKEN